METNLEVLRCGGCGKEDHRLYLKPNGDIIVECINCMSQSKLSVNRPEIEISGTLIRVFIGL